ncbi:unnamed protein product [Auanema sp. JU1783]|nr:unnamed protein product [Auanema sp. JU1783]
MIRAQNDFKSIDFGWSNRLFTSVNCSKCFGVDSTEATDNRFVDLLEFSQYNGVPWPLKKGEAPPKRWFSDIRYTLATPLPHKYPSVRNEVINSKRVEVAVAKLHEECPSLTFNNLNKTVCSYFTEIRATLSRLVCKLCAYVLYKTFRRLMTHLYVNPMQVKEVQAAHETGIPLVYLPLHKSHLDYLLITWCAWHFHLPLPHIASGDNLNLSGFGWLLRSTGAFFIRRPKSPTDSGGKDVIYRAVLHSYLEQLLKKGMHIEFFSEGTRSRFGKPLLPKHGLISNIVEALQEGTIKDCYLVPVSYTYDQVAEGVFYNELRGLPKIRESVIDVFRGVIKTFGLDKRCGAVRIHYGKPILLSRYLRSLSHCEPSFAITRMRHSYSYRELIPWHKMHEVAIDNRTLIRSIGFHVIHEAQQINSISPVAILSALMLSKHRRGGNRRVLANGMIQICEEILKEGGEVMGYRPGYTTGDDLVQYASRYLKDSLSLDDSLVNVKSFCAHHAYHLAYSRNSLVPLFALKSVIALVIMSHEEKTISPVTLVTKVIDLCQFLQFEVIFCKPCENLVELAKKKFHEMVQSEFIGNSCNESELLINDDVRKKCLFLASILKPFVQTFYFVTEALSLLSKQISEKDFVSNLCRKSFGYSLDINFEVLPEAFNSDSVRNCLNALREMAILKPDLQLQLNDSDKLQRIKESLAVVFTGNKADAVFVSSDWVAL